MASLKEIISKYKNTASADLFTDFRVSNNGSYEKDLRAKIQNLVRQNLVRQRFLIKIQILFPMKNFNAIKFLHQKQW